jgi:hypothetical protein
MEQTPFELTPEQKDMLATLSRKTGKPVPALLTEALAALQERELSGHEAASTAPPQQETPPPIWEQFADAFKDVPEEDIARLPTDLAAQVDHYIYGRPKRQA